MAGYGETAVSREELRGQEKSWLTDTNAHIENCFIGSLPGVQEMPHS